jgi:hypothetical protein
VAGFFLNLPYSSFPTLGSLFTPSSPSVSRMSEERPPSLLCLSVPLLGPSFYGAIKQCFLVTPECLRIAKPWCNYTTRPENLTHIPPSSFRSCASCKSFCIPQPLSLDVFILCCFFHVFSASAASSQSSQARSSQPHCSCDRRCSRSYSQHYPPACSPPAPISPPQSSPGSAPPS